MGRKVPHHLAVAPSREAAEKISWYRGCVCGTDRHMRMCHQFPSLLDPHRAPIAARNPLACGAISMPQSALLHSLIDLYLECNQYE